jgi:hypothetical protein
MVCGLLNRQPILAFTVSISLTKPQTKNISLQPLLRRSFFFFCMKVVEKKRRTFVVAAAQIGQQNKNTGFSQKR